jgi:protein gp37
MVATHIWSDPRKVFLMAASDIFFTGTTIITQCFLMQIEQNIG